ncbi:DNL zinc finger-domain-containing protein [Biscogniauxia marginata]|nr:DNL zinc finger-domain-containing protein [Biscogniauxia marginata]
MIFNHWRRMASKASLAILRPILRPSRTLSPSLLRPYPRLPRTSQPAARRFAHAIPRPPSKTPSNPSSSQSSSSAQDKPRKLLEPHYELTFTCVPCSERSTHVVSKQGYHKGSVLISCPFCRNRHIISDNLNIFGNRKITVEDLMRERGQLVKRGTLGEDGDVEFWEDGTVTERGGGSGAKTTEGTPGVAIDEMDASTEKEEATRMRDARSPSSQSTEPATSTESIPLGLTGARPSVGSSPSSHTVPSTRRQYSTEAPSTEQHLDEESIEQTDRGAENEAPERERAPLIRKVSGDGTPFTNEEWRRVKGGWREPDADPNLNSVKWHNSRGGASRVSPEELRAQLKWQHRRSYFADPKEISIFCKVSSGETFREVPTSPERRQVMEVPEVRRVDSTTRYRNPRFVGVDHSEGRSQYIRVGPGKFTKTPRPPGGPPQDLSEQDETASSADGGRPLKSQQLQEYTGEKSLEFEKLEEYSRASSDLWGNKTVTRKARDMIDEFVDRSS